MQTGASASTVPRGARARRNLPAASSDLEYLTGLERDLPSFGNLSYAHGWVAGAFLAPGREPLFVLPRMVVDFHLDGQPPAGAVVVHEDADGRALFAEAAREPRRAAPLAIGARAWAETAIELERALPGVELVEGSSLVNRLRRVKSPAELELMGRACALAREALDATLPRVEPGVTMSDLVEEVEHQLRALGSRCPSFPTHIFTWGARPLDSGDATADGAAPGRRGGPLRLRRGGRGLLLRLRPHDRLRRAAARVRGSTYGHACRAGGRARAAASGRARARGERCLPGADRGGRARRRLPAPDGARIGLDVHERPFLSVEEETPLEAGMTFTDEPSILVDGSFGIRVEDVIAVAPGGARLL